MFSTILSVLTGPFRAIAEAYITAKANTDLAVIERGVQQDVLTADIKKAVLESDDAMAEVIQRIMRDDMTDSRTSWIRPVTAGLSITFWVLLFGSQIEVGGDGIIPLIFHVPPGNLGVMYLAFPAGILATFYITRPFEKMGILRGRT